MYVFNDCYEPCIMKIMAGSGMPKTECGLQTVMYPANGARHDNYVNDIIKYSARLHCDVISNIFIWVQQGTHIQVDKLVSAESSFAERHDSMLTKCLSDECMWIAFTFLFV